MVVVSASDKSAASDTRHRVNYPNSKPRAIKLVGVGDGGARVARKVERMCLSGVDTVAPLTDRASGDKAPSSTGMLQAIALDGNELSRSLSGADMIFTVACTGDDVAYAAVVGQIARSRNVLVTGILIESRRSANERGGPTSDAQRTSDALDVLRAASDMLVIVSDESYVSEMLNALGA